MSEVNPMDGKLLQPGTICVDEDPVEADQEEIDRAWAEAEWTGEGEPETEDA
jgi:hypothetical protein